MNNLIAGTYCVTVTDANNCTATTCVTIAQPTQLQLSSTKVDVNCFGGTNGSIDLSVSGGTAGYTYAWAGGITTQDRSNLAAGTYCVTVTDANNCTASTCVTITQPAQLQLSNTKVDVACFGGSNGSIDLSVNGGTPGYTYNWGGGITTQDRTGLTAGTYCVTVTDANNCTTTVCVTITQPTQLQLSSTKVDVSCFGGNNGSINLTATGGTPTYSYNWGNGITTEDRTGLTAGTYCVTVTDANNCTATACVTITQPTQLQASTTKVDVSCFGGNNGSIALTVTGGTPTYTYNWSNNATTQNLNNLTAGSYCVTITDANACTTTTCVTISQPAQLQASTTKVDVSCFGGNNGSIDLSVSGGTAGYTYLWSPGNQTTQDIASLVAGTYCVTVTDANGCTTSTCVTITQPTQLQLSSTKVDVSCFGGSNGSIDLSVNGGTAAYTYNWSGGITTQDRTNLTAGTYCVTVTDANNCTATVCVTITQPTQLQLSTTKVDVNCFGGNNGSINLTATGGTPAYTYLWSNGQNTANLSNLIAGTYCVTVTDANNCTATTCVTITQPTQIVLSTIVTDVACNGGATGAVDLSVSGGVPGYNYLWSNGATTQDINNLVAGTYCVTVTDANGCTKTVCATVLQPNGLTVNRTITNVSCFGGKQWCNRRNRIGWYTSLYLSLE